MGGPPHFSGAGLPILDRAWGLRSGRRPKQDGRPVARPPALHNESPRNQFIALATLLSTIDTLLPTVFIAMMAATEISEAISTYSMAVAPSSFFISLRKMDSIEISK